MRYRPCLTAATLALVPLVAGAADHVALKPGLWEMTHQMDTNGRPPVPEDMLARMPPEARARMQAAVKANGAPRSDKQCLTQKDVERGFDPNQDRDTKCSNTIVSQSRTAMEIKVDCSRVGRAGAVGHGTFKWQAPTPESMRGTMDMTMTQGARSMSTHIQISGKWLGADCGVVKPRRRQAD